MKRRVFALLLAGVMALGLLAGCGGGNDDKNSTSGSNSSSSSNNSSSSDNSNSSGEVTDITLKVWCPTNQIETSIMDEQQKNFQAAHPEWNITWDVTPVGEDTCQENVLRDVDSAVDVYFFASDQLPDLVSAGAIAQLGGSTAEMVESNMGEAVVNTAKVDGNLYAIPFTHNTFFMFYDKSVLDESQIGSIESIMAADTGDNVYNFYFESSGGWKLGAWYYGAGLSVFGADGSDLSAGVDWNNATGLAVTNYLIATPSAPMTARSLFPS